MRRKNLWLRLSSCTMAALLATTSVAPVSAADFTGDVVMEEQQEAEDDADAVVIEEDSQGETSDDADVVEYDADEDLAAAETDLFTDSYEAGEAAEGVTDGEGEGETVKNTFGTANTELAKGTYTVPASLKKATALEEDSMAATAIAGDATLEVAEDGSAKVTVPLQNVTVGNVTAGSKDWKVYKDSTKAEETTVESTADEDGNTTSITFTVPDKTADGVYVSMTIAMGQGSAQEAYLKLDYAKAQAVPVAVDTTALEACRGSRDL